MQFDFLALLVVYVFKSVVILLLVVWGSEAFLPTPPYWPGSPSGQNSMHSHGLLNVLGLLCRMLYHLQTVSLLSSFCFILLSSWISQNYEHYKSITESKCSFSFLFFRRHLKSFVSVISEICFWYMIKFLLCSVFSDFFFMYSWAWISQVYLCLLYTSDAADETSTV